MLQDCHALAAPPFQVCYSWWCLSCLAILGRLHWIDRDALSAFILDCQVHRRSGVRSAAQDTTRASAPAEGGPLDPNLPRVATAHRNVALLVWIVQDEEDGGISDRPDDMADVYHTFFGIAGLSLMGYPGLAAIDPAWALPTEVRV